ncbi:uncharacterized protein YALI1_A05798g [Yarrowia lipolytica]|uniref:Uncharacterized protein n=1 Tax=Yarrowia lipolytica TaxID=4952 RepID=A0A1D8N3S2_YARLL|nr:hypothetical protein YALI1_A05798g [Yarrowia lipolytica]
MSPKIAPFLAPGSLKTDRSPLRYHDPQYQRLSLHFPQKTHLTMCLYCQSTLITYGFSSALVARLTVFVYTIYR